MTIRALTSTVLRRVSRDDRGENSIMQTISIAVSAILIVAGLLVAPSLIQAARNSNAGTDLANSAHAEEQAQANNAVYVGTVAVSGTLAAPVFTNDTTNTSATALLNSLNNATPSSSKLTVTSGEQIAILTDPNNIMTNDGGYVIVIGTAAPGTKWFGRTGQSTAIVPIPNTGTNPPTWAQINTAFGLGLTPTGSPTYYTVS